MASITSVAESFFAACETGKGWEVCRAYCAPDATFTAQAEPLLEVKTLAQYTDWMKGMMTQFDGDKIVHMTKIWHAGLAMKDLGWA